MKMEYCNIMKSIKLSFLLIFIILVISCRSDAAVRVEEPPAEPVTAVVPVKEEPVVEVQPVITEVAQLPVEEIIEVIVEPVEEAVVEAIEEIIIPAAEIVQPPEEVFVASQEQYDTTMQEVRGFIDYLNRAISNRNYGAWRAALSDEHFAEISSPENLQMISELPAMRTRRIVLRTAEDYFIHVVVPSRANSRVDDIEFFGRDRVKAFSINTNRAGETQRLVLYDLERVGDSWIIIN